jgi:hypothetical protein
VFGIESHPLRQSFAISGLDAFLKRSQDILWISQLSSTWEKGKAMGLTKFSIYKYVRTSKGWRYCKPSYRRNNKIRPDAILVDGKEEVRILPQCGRAVGEVWQVHRQSTGGADPQAGEAAVRARDGRTSSRARAERRATLGRH